MEASPVHQDEMLTAQQDELLRDGTPPLFTTRNCNYMNDPTIH